MLCTCNCAEGLHFSAFHLLLQLYMSLVLPHLEYASAIIWSPFLLAIGDN